MANLLNKLDCSNQTGGNTRLPTCFAEIGIPKSIFLMPKGHPFTAAQTATMAALLTVLQGMAQADARTNRGFLIGDFEAVEITGDDRVQETGASSGNKRTIKDGTIGYRFTIWEGGKTYHTLLKRAISGQQSNYNLVIIDDAGAMNGRLAIDSNGNRTFDGYTLTDLYVSKYYTADGSKGGYFTIDVFFADANEINLHFAQLKPTFDLKDALQGFIDVNLQGTSTVSNVVNITASMGDGNIDLHDTMSAALAQIGAWKAINVDAGNANYGNAITIASVANSGTGTSLTLAATGVDPDNPGTGKKVRISLVAPSALAALASPITGIESDSVDVVLF